MGFPAPEAYFGFEWRLRWPPRGPQLSNNAYDTRPGSVATSLNCYTPGKDLVVPVDAQISAEEVLKLPPPGAAGYRCAARRGKKHVFFMGGSIMNMGRREYSQVLGRTSTRVCHSVPFLRTLLMCFPI
jgi:hypothetical protein